jgi:hypothetical protein
MELNFLDFIEIGTSDFDTEIQTNIGTGISIEPVKYYIDRLPDKSNVTKLNIGISNYNGKSFVYYLSPENIEKYDFPHWVRGCNTINSYHKTVENLCKEKKIKIEDVSNCYEIDVKTLFSLFMEKQINGVYYVKIDTEGHDTVILKKFYEDIPSNIYLPHKILFESNTLSNQTEVNEIITLYESKGYDIIYKEHDTLLKLNLNKIKNKTKFTKGIRNYYIMDYPPNYDEQNHPHLNTLESAKEYCIKHNYSGVTLEGGVYSVRGGKYINYFNDFTGSLISWVYL